MSQGGAAVCHHITWECHADRPVLKHACMQALKNSASSEDHPQPSSDSSPCGGIPFDNPDNFPAKPLGPNYILPPDYTTPLLPPVLDVSPTSPLHEFPSTTSCKTKDKKPKRARKVCVMVSLPVALLRWLHSCLCLLSWSSGLHMRWTSSKQCSHARPTT